MIPLDIKHETCSFPASINPMTTQLFPSRISNAFESYSDCLYRGWKKINPGRDRFRILSQLIYIPGLIRALLVVAMSKYSPWYGPKTDRFSISSEANTPSPAMFDFETCKQVGAVFIGRSFVPAGTAIGGIYLIGCNGQHVELLYGNTLELSHTTYRL